MKILAAVSIVCCLWCVDGTAQTNEEVVDSFLTDYDEAVEQAGATSKPIFVYVLDSI